MNRRAYLASVAGVSGVLAGCFEIGATDGSSEDENGTPTPEQLPPTSNYDNPIEPDPDFDPTNFDGHIRPVGDPQTVPDELHCENEVFERRIGFFGTDDELVWGDLTNEEGEPVYELRVDSLAVEHGDTVNIVLMNVSDEILSLGNSGKANLDVYTETGWQDPRGWRDGLAKPVTTELDALHPGEYYHWTYKLTEDGVVRGDHGPRATLVTCPDLPAGRYRFVSTAPQEGNVGVAFEMSR